MKEEVDIEALAGNSLEKDNKYHPNGINPSAYSLGFKAGYKASSKEEVSWLEAFSKYSDFIIERGKPTPYNNWLEENYNLIKK